MQRCCTPPEGTPSALHKYPEFTGVALKTNHASLCTLNAGGQISSNILLCTGPLSIPHAFYPAPGQQTEPQKPSRRLPNQRLWCNRGRDPRTTRPRSTQPGPGLPFARRRDSRRGARDLSDRNNSPAGQHHLELNSRNPAWQAPILADYPHTGHTSEGRDTALILAEGVHDVAIIGEGTSRPNVALYRQGDTAFLSLF